MLELLNRWYQRRFTDPAAVTLTLILVMGFAVVYFLGAMLMPLFIALVLAFLFELPVGAMTRYKIPRAMGASIMVLAFIAVMLLMLLGIAPLVWKQGDTLIRELPKMVEQGQAYLMRLPEQYPGYINNRQIEELAALAQSRVLNLGKMLISGSLNSIANVVTIMVYAVLVPLLLFFLLKDKQWLLASLERFLPANRHLADRVMEEMNLQILNYVRGKVIEILIVGVASYVTFTVLGVRYAELLAVLVGLSVVIPYIGAVAVTIPVLAVGLFQWGLSNEFWYLMIAYGVIQALDGNVLVPLLFSEAVNLHPLVIIVAVLFFGGIWGFWGVFFAIPLATLVKAVINVWPASETHAAASD